MSDVLLVFLWMENGNILYETSVQSCEMASFLLSKDENELRILLAHDNLLLSEVDVSKMEKIKVYRVGTIQELYLNA